MQLTKCCKVKIIHRMELMWSEEVCCDMFKMLLKCIVCEVHEKLCIVVGSLRFVYMPEGLTVRSNMTSDVSHRTSETSVTC
jgi:hypothetical protein